VNLRRGEGRPLVIGHRGAAAVAPENTLASLEAAVDAGVDLVEFDVLPGLRLGHSLAEAADDPLSLDDALAFLAAQGIGVHIDLKHAGYERAAADALRRHGLAERALVSTAYASIARRVRAVAPDLPVAIGYPRDRLGVSRLAWPDPLTQAGAALLRRAMPVRVPLLLRRAGAGVLALHHTLCSGRAVAAAHRRGVPVLAWTVNDEGSLRRAVAAGVDAVVTDDPKTVLATLRGL
jgi:glycerophosphoryl diester phosphodiesterase